MIDADVAAPINVFISRSGRRSRELAEKMRKWLPGLFSDGQIGELFLSSDIDKGRPWFEQLSEALNQSHAALLCLTSANVTSPWMHFEAGAIAKTLFSAAGDPVWQPDKPEPRMFTYLHQVRPSELSGPLAQYQATLADRKDTRRLVESLARLSPWPDRNEVWLQRFDELWPDLEEDIRSIQSLSPSEAIPQFEARFRRKTFREPVADCTNQTWTDRHAGARETLSQLQADEAILEQRCRPFHVDLFRELLAELDGYATSIEALLIGRPRFPLGDDGRLDIDSGTEQACERRRKRIEELVSQLLDPFMAPLSDESWQFVRAPTLEARPSVVHRKKHEMRGWSDLRREKAADHHDSPWELDRIVAYLVQLEQPPAEAGDLLAAANGEVNRAYRDDSSRPPMALYYALRAIEETLASGPVDRDVSRGIQGLIARLEGPDAKVTEDRAEFQFGEVLARLHQHLTRGADASDGHDVGEPRASASPGAAATPLAPGP